MQQITRLLNCINHPIRNCFFAAAFAVMLVSCGGGGGGSNTITTPENPAAFGPSSLAGTFNYYRDGSTNNPVSYM